MVNDERQEKMSTDQITEQFRIFGTSLALATRQKNRELLTENFKASMLRANTEHDSADGAALMERARLYGIVLPPVYMAEGLTPEGDVERHQTRVAPSCIDIEYPSLNRFDFVSTSTAAFLLGKTPEELAVMAVEKKAIHIPHVWAPMHTGGVMKRAAWPIVQFVNGRKGVEVNPHILKAYWTKRQTQSQEPMIALASTILDYVEAS